jgi:UDP-arabinose 4-epimerase
MNRKKFHISKKLFHKKESISCPTITPFCYLSAGYIGSHVVGISTSWIPPDHNLVYGHRWAVKWGPLEEGDVTDRKRLDAVFHQYQPEAVMHFAGYAYVGESVQNPGKYYRNNVGGSLTVLEAMRDYKVKNIIFSSTCATYGIPRMIPIVVTRKID